MTIDAHIHLWRLARGDNIYLTPDMAAIYRDLEPPQLRPRLDAAGVERIVAVQAAETLAEALYLIDRKGYERAGYLWPFASRFATYDMRALATEKAA